MKKNKNKKIFDLHFDDNINLDFNSRATKYINKHNKELHHQHSTF
jgi:hypothetical protein